MSENNDQSKQTDNKSLIMTAATLTEAAMTDPRLQPLAQAAMKLVLESDTAIAELVATYKQFHTAPQPSADLMPSQVAAQLRQKDSAAQLLETLQKLTGQK